MCHFKKSGGSTPTQQLQKRQQQRGRLEKTVREAERRSDTKGDRLKVIKGWGMTSVRNISGT